MNQRKILFAYVAGMTISWSTLGGFIACGAQNYRVAVDDDTNTRVVPNSSAGRTGQSGANTQQLTGIHSPQGWGAQLPIHFQVSIDFDASVTTELQAAMHTWEKAVGKKLFQLDGVDKRRGSDFVGLFKPLDDAINGHYYDFAWSANTSKSNTVLASTLWENDPHNPNVLTKADIRYNAEFYIFGDCLKEYSQGKRTIVDMESLALHELGHLLGLSHISLDVDKFSVMNPSLFIGEGMTTRRLSKGDIERIQSVYPTGDKSESEKLERADDFSSETI